MIALPAAPAAPPRRQLIVGTAVAGRVAAMAVGGMLAVWWRFREAAPLKLSSDKGKMLKDFVPKSVKIQMVPANILVLTMIMACLVAQYAVYAAKRSDRANTLLGVGLTGLMGLAALNAQSFLWHQSNAGVSKSRYESMFFAVTGTWFVLVIVGVVFTLVTAFRYVGGRTADSEVVASHALFWYILTGISIAVWFVVYVTK